MSVNKEIMKQISDRICYILYKGNLVFEESAEKFGLADTSYSSQAAFFDFDKDGDLDMYLLTTTNKIRNPKTEIENSRARLERRPRFEERPVPRRVERPVQRHDRIQTKQRTGRR